MATLATSADPAMGFTASLFGAPVRELVDYMGQLHDRASHYLNDRAREWTQAAGDVFQKADYSNIMRKAKKTMRELQDVIETDHIRPLTSVELLQDAPHSMRRWIMAEPSLRRLYHEGGCEGYGDFYVDVQPGAVGADHYDYRRARDGVVEVEENGNWHAESYIETLRDGDDAIDTDDQFDIDLTWIAVRRAVEVRRDDPTSLFNASL